MQASKRWSGEQPTVKNACLPHTDVCQMAWLSNHHRSLVNSWAMPAELGNVVPVVGVPGKQSHRQESLGKQGVACARREGSSQALETSGHLSTQVADV